MVVSFVVVVVVVVVVVGNLNGGHLANGLQNAKLARLSLHLFLSAPPTSSLGPGSRGVDWSIR